jgi:NAD(P)-dependent dehydrogenase (short-subunit alcohol dehydrogenase family)
MNFQQGYSWKAAYCRSKVANILFARMLQVKMDRAHIDGFSVAVHPGAIYSDLGRDFGYLNYIIKRLLFPVILIMFKTSW